MTRTRVKICGITRAEDGLIAAKYGVDAIGLVFYEKSPRAVNIEPIKMKLTYQQLFSITQP